jgi:glyoxylate reductase
MRHHCTKGIVRWRGFVRALPNRCEKPFDGPTGKNAAVAHCFVTRQLPGSALDRLRAQHDVDVWVERLPPPADEIEAHAAEAEGLLTMLTDRIDASMLERLPHLRAISNYAVGYDNIDVAAASERGIAIGNTPDVLTEATADLTFALLLAAARKLRDAAADVHGGDWLTWEPARYLGADVFGATLGIIGMGRIGRAVAKRASGFEMRVIGVGAGDPIDELLASSDFVSLHCPLTPETHHLIDADALSAMRSTAILVNTARGPIVDHHALRWALEANVIAGAALDVTEPEPIAADDPLLSAPNLLVVPHIGSATQSTRERMADIAVDNLLAALAGEAMPHQVAV